MTTARTRQQVSPLTVEIASLIDGAMASRRPKMTQLDLSHETGIGQSQISRMLAPTKPMFVEEFVAICQALTLDPTTVIREAEKRAGSVSRATAVDPISDVDITAAGPDVDEPARHFSPVPTQDIAAGAVLPMQGGRPRPQRRSRQTSDTTEKHHK